MPNKMVWYLDHGLITKHLEKRQTYTFWITADVQDVQGCPGNETWNSMLLPM